MTYPVYEKSRWGSPYWFTFENTMATMPKDATPEVKEKYRKFGELLVELLPCQDCSDHAKEDLSLDVSDPKNAFTSVCNLHNKVNAKNGKEQKDCGSLFSTDVSDAGCSSCSIDEKQVQEGEKRDDDKDGGGQTQVLQNAQTGQGGQNQTAVAGTATDSFDSVGQPQVNKLDQKLKQYNNLAVKIFKDLCRQHNIPVPKNIQQQACPVDQSTSCNLYEGDKADVYLHPIVTSLRTIFHEFDHYKDVVTGNSGAIDEGKANNFVASSLGTMFAPGPGATNVSPNVKAAKEDDTSEKFVTAEVKENVSEKTIGEVDKELSQNVKASYYDVEGQDTSFMNNFPMLKQTLTQIESEKELIKEKKVSKDGVLKHIDHFYDRPAKY